MTRCCGSSTMPMATTMKNCTPRHMWIIKEFLWMHHKELHQLSLQPLKKTICWSLYCITGLMFFQKLTANRSKIQKLVRHKYHSTIQFSGLVQKLTAELFVVCLPRKWDFRGVANSYNHKGKMVGNGNVFISWLRASFIKSATTVN